MDRQLDKRIRQRIHRMYGDRFSEEVLKTPDYSLIDEKRYLKEGVEREEFFGSYGGYAEFEALAKMFKLNIVLWDENEVDLMCPDWKWPVFLNDGSIVNMIPADITKLMSEPSTTIHIAWSETTEAHFEAYVDDHEEYPRPRWLLNMMKG